MPTNQRMQTRTQGGGQQEEGLVLAAILAALTGGLSGGQGAGAAGATGGAEAAAAGAGPGAGTATPTAAAGATGAAPAGAGGGFMGAIGNIQKMQGLAGGLMGKHPVSTGITGGGAYQPRYDPTKADALRRAIDPELVKRRRNLISRYFVQ